MLVSHQENPESASTKLEALGTISIELTTLVLGISIILFIVQKYTKALGEHISVLLWTGHFDGSAFVKNHPGGIALNRLGADGADCGSTEADRLYTIA